MEAKDYSPNINNIILYFEQNDASLGAMYQYLEKLAEAIDAADWKTVGFYLEMLRGIYHNLEGNNRNIRTIVVHENPALEYLMPEE